VRPSGDQLAHINRRQITAEKLDAALRDVIDRFNRFTLPHFWGDEQRAAADGTQYELAEDNLLAEKHIRYGGYGGIAYHHVSDLYIRVLGHSSLCACRQQEGTLVDSGQANASSVLQKGLHNDTNSDGSCSAPCCQAPDPG
jgi:TnpA family transposase